MTLCRLIEDLQRIALTVHPMTPTSAFSVRFEPERGVMLEDTREEEWENKIKEFISEAEDRQTSLDTVESELKGKEIECDALQLLLDEVKEEGLPGKTISYYRHEATTAMDHAHTWRIAYEDMKNELTSLRKRKGLTTGFVRFERAILEHPAWSPEGKTILKKIHLSSTL